MKIKFMILAFFAFFGVCIPIYVSAEETQLSVRTVHNLVAGRIHDDTPLGQIYISNMGEHCGFNVWLDALPNKQGGFILQGVNSDEKLYVRLSGRGLHPFSDGNGVIIGDGDSKFSTINIVVDGEQNVLSDVWKIQVNGSIHKCRQ